MYDDVASDILTDENVKLPRYFPFVKGADELESVVTFIPSLNHSNLMIGINSPFCCATSHSNVACCPSLIMTLLRTGLGAP